MSLCPWTQGIPMPHMTLIHDANPAVCLPQDMRQFPPPPCQSPHPPLCSKPGFLPRPWLLQNSLCDVGNEMRIFEGSVVDFVIVFWGRNQLYAMSCHNSDTFQIIVGRSEFFCHLCVLKEKVDFSCQKIFYANLSHTQIYTHQICS